jgi:drug/metabolite transporter (DMT)-like permease
MKCFQRCQRLGHLNPTAILLMLSGGLVFAVMNGIVKELGQRYDVTMIFFWRSASAFLIILPLLHLYPEAGGLRTTRFVGHTIRGLFGVAGTLCFFWTMTQLPLGTAVTLAYAWPIFMLGISVCLLGEQMSWRRTFVAAAGFCGVIMICGFSLKAPTLGLAAGLASAILFACAYASIRSIANTESPTAISFYFHAWCSIAGFALTFPNWIWPASSDLPALVATGVLGGIAQCLIAAAFRLERSSQLASYDYFTVVWSLLIGWLVWGDTPTLTGLAGTSLIAVSGFAMARVGQPDEDRREDEVPQTIVDITTAPEVTSLDDGPRARTFEHQE